MTTISMCLQYTDGSFKASDLLVQRIEQPKARQETQVQQHQLQFACQILSIVRDQLSRQQTYHNVLVVQDLVFGASFTDHMFLVEHIDGKGWGQPVIKPFGSISVHPAAQTLHYGVCCFEGMKAYLGKDGKARLFRYDCCTQVTCSNMT